MTTIRKTTSTETTTEQETETTAPDPAATVIGPPLRTGQKPENVTFAHHLRIAARDFAPGDTAYLSPDYARQLRRNGYLARGRT